MKKEEKILADHEIDAVGKALRPHLDRAARELPTEIAARLAKAREVAVAKAAARETQTATDVVSNGNSLALSSGGGWRDRLGDWRFWATGLVVAALVVLYSANEYQDAANAREAAEVELMILGDDVPVDALLDKGFKNFLREENN
jgi:Protein of unknown function (DUF3619)